MAGDKDRDDKVTCGTPTPGKSPTRIDRWKYDLVRSTILDVVPAHDDGVQFGELAALVGTRLSDDEKARLGSLAWYTTTVKLHMECEGEIERIAGSKPQRLRRVAGS